MSTSSPPTDITDRRGRGCTRTLSGRPRRAARPGGADDRARPDRDVAGLDIVAGASDVVAGSHRLVDLDPHVSAVGAVHRQDGVRESRQRRTGVDRTACRGWSLIG